MIRRAATHLMFTGEATSALALYAAVFPDFEVRHMQRYDEGPNAGQVQRADCALKDLQLVVIDSPVKHAFTFTPAMSLFVDFERTEDLDAAFATLSEGGQVFMPLENYGFSTRFGWCADRYGVSWQLNLP